MANSIPPIAENIITFDLACPSDAVGALMAVVQTIPGATLRVSPGRNILIKPSADRMVEILNTYERCLELTPEHLVFAVEDAIISHNPHLIVSGAE